MDQIKILFSPPFCHNQKVKKNKEFQKLSYIEDSKENRVTKQKQQEKNRNKI